MKANNSYEKAFSDFLKGVVKDFWGQALGPHFVRFARNSAPPFRCAVPSEEGMILPWVPEPRN